MSLKPFTNDFPTYSALRISKLLLDEARRLSDLQQASIYALIDLLTNKSEDIVALLEGNPPMFCEPWQPLFPKNEPNGKNDDVEGTEGDHLYTSATDRRTTRDSDFVNRYKIN